MKVDIFDLVDDLTCEIYSELLEDFTDPDGMADILEGIIEERLQSWLDDGKISLGS